jgi:hypothetical protein
MAVTLPQVNSLYQRISDPAFDPKQIEQVNKELCALEAKPHTAAIQKAIDKTRIHLHVIGNQAEVAAKVAFLYKNIIAFNEMLASQPRLTMPEYNQMVGLLNSLRQEADSLLESDFLPDLPKTAYIEHVDRFKLQLEQFHPTAWKTDMVAAAIIASSVTALFGYQGGWSLASKALVGGIAGISIAKIGIITIARITLSIPAALTYLGFQAIKQKLAGNPASAPKANLAAAPAPAAS